jgi:hypothetical protein
LSSRLEGNTYSLLDTRRLLAFSQQAEGKDAAEAQMILNHKDAIEFMVSSAEEISFNRYSILNLHGLLANNLLPDPTASGGLRRIPVGIHGSAFHPLEVPALIEECFDQLLATAEAIADPFEQAFFVMAQLPYLQPFEDVNKRVSRLAANIPLIRANLCPLSFTDVPTEIYTQAILGVYELSRIELLKDVFLWAYRRSAERYALVRQSLGEPDPFRLRFRDDIRQLVAEIVRDRLGRRPALKHIQRWTPSRRQLRALPHPSLRVRELARGVAVTQEIAVDPVPGARRWCMNRLRGEDLPISDRSDDREGLRHPQLGHPVEDVAADERLSSLRVEADGSQSAAEYSLVTEEGVLSSTLLEVARLLSPSWPAQRSNF